MFEVGMLIVAALALALAAAMGAVAWKVSRAERRRSESRVAALAADIREADAVREPVVVHRRADIPRLQPATARKFDLDVVDWRPVRQGESGPQLFRFEQEGQARSRLFPVLALGILAVVAALAFVVVASPRQNPVQESAPSIRPASPDQASTTLAGSIPLELLALGQERDNDRLTVRGVVRNPQSGVRLDRLAAVVLLFTRGGQFLGTGRAPIRTSTLTPGVESMFTVTVANARDVGRYRVRFQSDDRVVPHVDRRSRALSGSN